jgi:DNA invertase Pin-like site-specific DNA recombinase
MTKRRAIAYLRVSTKEQADDGFGLAVQEDDCRRYCQERGLRLVDVASDAGQSGSNGLETRLALADALGALTDQRADVLVVARLDRLARDAVLQESLFREVQTIGAELASAKPGEAQQLLDDPDDPSRKLIRQILGSLAEYERELIGLRMRAGKARKARDGGYSGGQPAYGSRAVDKELAADPDEAAIVARVRRLRADGRSYRQVCAVLEAEGYRPRRAAAWQPAVVRRIARRA